MLIAAVSLRDFRSHGRAELKVGSGITVLAGPNGSGKTNILEALHFGLTGRSCRTSSDRQVITHGKDTARVEVQVEDETSTLRSVSVALDRSGNKQIQVDGTPVDRTDSGFKRPLVNVFLPDRLSLVTGPPGGRRAHLDGFAAALRPSVSGVRAEYNRVLIQRNSLIAAARATGATPGSLSAWNSRLAAAGAELVASRQEAVDAVASYATAIGAELGLLGTLEISLRSGGSSSPEEFEAKLVEQLDADIDRGYTHHGPHRGDLLIRRDGRDVKDHASQGEKRLALLSLLLAEREAISEVREAVQLLLLDDVMSELDATRRELLVRRVATGGQCLITATEFAHVPEVAGVEMVRVSLGDSDERKLRVA
jgi:DNA replication and repair protein RecF